jgi:lipid A 3-O-deacylase
MTHPVRGETDPGLCDWFSFQVENDETGGSDRNYTGGLRLACAKRSDLLGDIVLPSPEGGPGGNRRATFSLGQSVFTPDDLTRRDLIEDDQPYAGWLYFGLGIERETARSSDRPGYLDNLELQLGVVGPLSGAEQLQKYIHDVLDANEPKGWGNQLDNEPGINLFYSRQWTGAASSGVGPKNAGLSLDMTPEIGLALGNVYTFGAAGVGVRFGSLAPNDPGPPVIRPGLPGSDSFPAGEGFSAYLLAAVEGRAVARNIFLDGNSFQDTGTDIDKETLVGEARLGLVLTYDRVRLAYTQVFRSAEFDGEKPQTYGSISLAIAF